MDLFYEPTIDAPGQYKITQKEHIHLTKVFRYKLGDTMKFTNGRGGIFEAIILNVYKKHSVVELTKVLDNIENKPLLHIAIAPTKNIARFEWFLEKITEIGIGEITPILCKHSERKHIKVERLNKVLIAAMKQSQSSYLPKLNELITWKDFLKELPKADLKLLATCNEGNKKTLKAIIKKDVSSLITIGPEGDFSQEEIESALDNKFELLSLGNKRLRTETAGVVACNIFNFLNE